MYMTLIFYQIVNVIFKIALVLLSIIIAVGGCFYSIVQNTSNKACTSIIIDASHGSGGE